MKIQKIIFGGIAIFAIASVIVFKVGMKTNNVLSPLLLSNIEALGNPEGGDGYSCSVEMQCCGSKSNVTVKCTGTNKCESLTDGWGYKCKGVRCDGKETLC